MLFKYALQKKIVIKKGIHDSLINGLTWSGSSQQKQEGKKRKSIKSNSILGENIETELRGLVNQTWRYVIAPTD